MAKKKKKAAAASLPKSFKATSFGPIIRTISETENRVRQFKVSAEREASKKNTLLFLEKMRSQFEKKCKSSDAETDDKNFPFWLLGK